MAFFEDPRKSEIAKIPLSGGAPEPALPKVREAASEQSAAGPKNLVFPEDMPGHLQPGYENRFKSALSVAVLVDPKLYEQYEKTGIDFCVTTDVKTELRKTGKYTEEESRRMNVDTFCLAVEENGKNKWQVFLGADLLAAGLAESSIAINHELQHICAYENGLRFASQVDEEKAVSRASIAYFEEKLLPFLSGKRDQHAARQLLTDLQQLLTREREAIRESFKGLLSAEA